MQIAKAIAVMFNGRTFGTAGHRLYFDIHQIEIHIHIHIQIQIQIQLDTDYILIFHRELSTIHQTEIHIHINKYTTEIF